MHEQPYQARIRTILAARHQDLDPRHVEGWMRAENGTLDALSQADFEDEALLAIGACEQAEPEITENLARSYGL